MTGDRAEDRAASGGERDEAAANRGRRDQDHDQPGGQANPSGLRVLSRPDGHAGLARDRRPGNARRPSPGEQQGPPRRPLAHR